jgi:hypothetical protein
LLKLPTSVKTAAARLAKAEGVSLNQFIAAAVAEKVGVMETALEFLERRDGDAKPKALLKYCARRDASSRSNRTVDRVSRTSGSCYPRVVSRAWHFRDSSQQRVRPPGRSLETRIPPANASNPLTRSGRRMQTASLIGESRRSCAEFINPLRCFGLRQRIIEFLAGLSTQRLEVRALCIGHRLVAGFPFFRVPLQCRLSGIIR